MTDGANPPQRQFYPTASPDLTEAEFSRVADALHSTWISSTGSYLDEFEEVFGSACGVSHVIPVANGTVALHVILLGLGIGTGDEVIVPSMTYIATANAVTYTGATPVFADVSPDTWCLDPEQVASLVTTRTAAIIAVHLYGHPADMDRLAEIADRHSLALIEDAAEAPFATYRGRPTGSLGVAASFSFYGNKVITSGEGGAVATNDDPLARRIRLLRGQGVDPERRYYFPVVGYNYRLTNVAAAMLCGQMSRRDELMRRRQSLFAAYDDSIARCPRVERQPIAVWARPTPWLYSILLRDVDASTRDEVMVRLSREQVETRPFFIPIHRLPPYQDPSTTVLPVTDDLGERGMSLPTSSIWGADDAYEIVARLERVLDSL